MGLTQLSMNPAKLPAACRLISKIRYPDTLQLADDVLGKKTLKEIEGLLLEYNLALK